jgi:hypothetical protein
VCDQAKEELLKLHGAAVEEESDDEETKGGDGKSGEDAKAADDAAVPPAVPLDEADDDVDAELMMEFSGGSSRPKGVMSEDDLSRVVRDAALCCCYCSVQSSRAAIRSNPALV